MSVYMDPIIDNIVIARVGLLLRHSFFGNMATRMKLIEENDWCKTAATDFKNLYFNRDFFTSMNVRQIEFVLAHEILHICFEHAFRRDGRNPQIWNIACDYCVNGILKSNKIGEDPPIKFYYDRRYNGWSAEQVYDEIFNSENQKQLISLGELLDHHIDPDGKDKDGNPSYSKEQIDKLRDDIKEAMIQAASAAGAGNVPAEVGRLITEFTEPKMNWRELLQQQIQSLVKSDYTFSRPSRKNWHSGAILPGSNFANTIDVCVAIDMSGSISNAQASDFIGEVKGIMDEFKEFNMKLMTFDTQVYNVVDFDSYSAEEIFEYEIMGGGGTDFMCVWNYLKEVDNVPKRLLIFTDMYPNSSWGDEDYCPTTFIGHGTTSIVAPFGDTVYYSEE